MARQCACRSRRCCVIHHAVHRRVYTGGADSLVRLWDPELGEDQEPSSAAEAGDEVTTVAAGVRPLPIVL